MMGEKILITDLHRRNLKNIRKEMGIRTDSLSEMIHKAPSYISQIETGRIKTITKYDFKVIADAIGCNVNIILDLDNAKSNVNTDSYSMLISENIALKKENEYLKKKLEDIMRILSQ